jgi:uncharacterized SAM-binding protein YcdF (DUF218 family)
VRDRLALIGFGVALVVIPGWVLLTDTKAPGYDALRAFVLVQGVAVFCLTSYTLGWVGVRLVKAQKISPPPTPDPQAKKVIMGSLARNFGILVLLIGGMLNLIGRFNNTHLDHRTPVFQLALLFLFYGWALIDRRIYRTTRTPQQLVGGIIVEKAVAEAKQMAQELDLEDSSEAFREAHEKRKQKHLDL